LFNPIETLKELIKELVNDIINAAFSWLKVFMIKPTDFKQYVFIEQMHNWVWGISISVAIMFLTANLLKIMIQKMGGYSQRSISEIVTKTIIGVLLGIFAPFLLQEVLLRINNTWVEFVVSRGINVNTLTKVVIIDPQVAGIGLCLTMLLWAVLLLILAFQYIIRLGELMVLYLFSSIAAITHGNEDMNIWTIWWREAIAVVFQQSVQITVLWVVFNQITAGTNINDYMLACGLMIVLLMIPSFLRKFIYSSGSGRLVTSAAGGAGRMAIYKYAANKVIRR
jgi:hypothetical protein